MPWAEVTAVERVGTIPAAGAVIGFTVGVTNNLDARTSALVLDSDLSLDDDGGVLVAAATLLAGAAYPPARNSHRSAPLQASVSPTSISADATPAEAAASAEPSMRSAHPETSSDKCVSSKPVSIVDEMSSGVDRRGDGLVAQSGRRRVDGHMTSK